MTDKQKQAIDRLTSRDRYFASHSKDTILFAREYHVSNQIQNIIADKTNLTEADFELIVNVFNKIEEDEHYDGSGWFDYKLILGHLFHTFGYDIKWDSSNKTIDSFRPYK